VHGGEAVPGQPHQRIAESLDREPLNAKAYPPLSAVYCRSLNSEGSASAAGARPGLQNRGRDASNAISHKKLRKETPYLTAQGQRADSNVPIKVAIDAAWDRLPEDVKGKILEIVQDAMRRGDRE
jgi:hypothetical protein